MSETQDQKNEFRQVAAKTMTAILKGDFCPNDYESHGSYADALMTWQAKICIDNYLRDRGEVGGHKDWWDASQCTVEGLKAMAKEHIDRGDFVTAAAVNMMMFMRDSVEFQQGDLAASDAVAEPEVEVSVPDLVYRLDGKENWHISKEDLFDAINEDASIECGALVVYHVGTPIPQSHASSVDGSHLLDTIRQSAYDNFNEHALDYLDELDSEKEQELGNIIVAWLERNAESPRFYLVGEIRQEQGWWNEEYLQGEPVPEYVDEDDE